MSINILTTETVAYIIKYIPKKSRTSKTCAAFESKF